ncbi:MAG: hypothetical protein JSS39_11845 [Nitrospira sp.]|nr:hypothetical protein [Nitrospira sp.]
MDIDKRLQAAVQSFLMATNSPKTKIAQPLPDLTFHRFVAALQGHVVTFLGSQKT